MDCSRIVEKFKANAKKRSTSHPLSKSSVLVPIIEVKDEPHILFQIRSLDLNTQPGEVCFPGGKVEKNETPQQSAVRETIEELNISEKTIEIIGKLDPIVTTFNMIIYPYCGVLRELELEKINFNKEEVHSLFTVPVQDLLNQKPLTHKLKINTTPDDSFPFHLIQNGNDYRWKVNDYYVYFYNSQNHVIWGITAKILKNFLDILSDK